MNNKRDGIVERSLLISIFFVSASSIYFETSLNRFFAISKWEEYGYLVVSITMVGYSLGSIILYLFKGFFLRSYQKTLLIIPTVLMVLFPLSFYFISINPFNPLELQNPDVWMNQIVNIGKYYLAIFPVFVLVGLYIGLNYLILYSGTNRIYAADLIGAGVGSILILVFMYFIHPFYLLSAIIPFLLLVSILNIRLFTKRNRGGLYFALFILFILSEAGIIFYNRADFCEYKAIYAPLHVENNRIISKIKSPKGYYLILDNYTERLDEELSNDYALLKVKGYPIGYGLYRDGNRLTTLIKEGHLDTSYLNASLDLFPYLLKNDPSVLLIGSHGGFRIKEVLTSNSTSIIALDSDDVISSYVKRFDELSRNNRVKIYRDSPISFLVRNQAYFDIIDISTDFLNQSTANKYAFTKEAFSLYLTHLKEGGILSIPVSISESTVYALKIVNTAMEVLRSLGVVSPENCILVYRASWNARVLVSRSPFDTKDIQRLKDFCYARSFDTSYYPGINPKGIKTIWNDLPPIFPQTKTSSPQDSLMDDIQKVLFFNTRYFSFSDLFNIAPSSFNRPNFFFTINLKRLREVLRLIALLPREEIGFLVNFGVIIQSIIFALFILFLPLIKEIRTLRTKRLLFNEILYFLSLGLVFMFIEILLFDKMSLVLNDYTSSFAVVLASMLFFSGFGSYYSQKYIGNPLKGVGIAISAIVLLLLFYTMFLDKILIHLMDVPLAFKLVSIVSLVAPLSFFMGFPFPLGLSTFVGDKNRLLPWALSINGAFSVIGTPLANVLSIFYGYRLVLVLSIFLYLVSLLTFPERDYI
ncbi:MAG: hypothetical protein ACP5K2_06495 [bacterium]